MKELLELIKKYGLSLLLSALFIYNTFALNQERQESNNHIKLVQAEYIKSIRELNQEHQKQIDDLRKEYNTLIEKALKL